MTGGRLTTDRKAYGEKPRLAIHHHRNYPKPVAAWLDIRLPLSVRPMTDKGPPLTPRPGASTSVVFVAAREDGKEVVDHNAAVWDGFRAVHVSTPPDILGRVLTARTA